MSIPQDPVMLLSYLNTQLRNHYENLDDLCLSLSIDKDDVTRRMAAIQYSYDERINQFT